MYSILRREAFSDVTFLWEVHAPDVAASAQPGHFVMLRLHEGSERIPLTVADFDREKGTITMVIQALGKTTREMMTNYKAGDTFDDFVGPLGLPQHIDNAGHVVLVGGGLGVAPVYPQLRAFKEAGCRTTGIIGFRNKDLVFWEKKFGKYCDDLIVCTDDGSYGKPGFVTQALKEVCEQDKPDLAIAIGPLPMMNACVETTRPFGVKTMVSLNAIMVDGTGMCGSCRVTVGKDVKFACVDGPDFDGHQVDFKELLARQRRFKSQESRANEDYAHVCNLEKQLFEEEKRNYKKLKELVPTQTKMPERDHVERARNFKEVNLGYSLQDALGEAERCIQCAKPTCIAGCPVQIDIPRFIRHVVVRDLEGALEVINEASIFPSVCGRVCPQETQCEAQCIIAKKMESVGIGRLERFVGDNARPKPVVPPRFDKKLGKVAVCGSGPAGLAAAADLVKFGCDVTVYEALHVVGGVLRYGIPSFRLPRDIIDREVNKLVEMGVKIETNKVIGKTFTVPQLLNDKGFDAVFLGVGAGAPQFLGIPGEFAGQVYSANEFLTRVNLMGGDKFPFLDTPISLGKSVVVIGAGNTAMDCLRVAKRLGAPTVRCVYRRSEAEAPARIEELRHAKEEGIDFFFLHTPVEIYTDAEGSVRGMKVEEMELGAPDDKGRRKPMSTGRFKDLECDTVIYALGTKANPIITQSTPGLGLNKWGNIAADDGKLESTQATTLPGVFAGGDIVTGGATVILAMGAGRRAARSIATYLTNGKKWPLTQEEVAAFQPMAQLAAAPAAQAGLHTHAGAVAAGAETAVKTCPKCRRPIEGDEEYVCCGTAQLQWRCDDCGKVSEGFAFPYGMCPACGGKLQVTDPRKVEEAKALEAIRLAFEIELGGMAFYAKAAKDSKEPVLKALFEKFAGMEQEHMATLTRRYHAQAPSPTEGFKIERAALFAGLENRPDDPGNLFRIAIGFEQRAVKFFTERGAAAPEGSPEKQLYKELAAEEREHVDLLTTEYERWKQGKPGML
ncbi:glutamate synthase (NADPH), homotetrameric [Anaeromyxobacter dehalogenans 2CP-1]|uniref:Glutamate synthase (NADPH), homotetrameric n=1 Tax=Anaeromyxobacter dehalogenans (strain ATCC BAA-258 / DSM 21875 / 2CP-1) TaxID=455488 RepID=B8JFD7_ANAD2|nr:NADPH-dependent glutamate synthase [Anaeromyxobacter dehalogenans]ACL66314.1 glutamate synthase (NADPH), homotetrameric [Anaeromyxobacter dehalogenans 2CP-1]